MFNLNPLPSSRFFLTLNLGSAGNFLASPPGILKLPSGPLHDKIKSEIVDVVRKVIGPIAKPDKIQIVSGLPKTRSGKIMRRILRKVASNDFGNLGDTSTLLNPDIVEEIIKGAS